MGRIDLSGLGVVNATPMHPDGSINEDAYAKHVVWLAECGVSYVVPAAATGEVVTLSEEERRRLVSLAVEALDGRAKVVAYAGRASTVETVGAVRAAEEAGAHAAYVVQPWFAKPDQRGIYEHFRAAANAVDGLPLIIYNNPDRTACVIEHDTMGRILDNVPAYQAIKDADHSSLLETFARFGTSVPVYPRSERESLWALASGGNGFLSFSGNYMPRELRSIIDFWQSGKTEEARSEYLRVYPLMNAVFAQALPATVKYILSELGFPMGDPRMPILPIRDDVKIAVDKLMRELQIAK